MYLVCYPFGILIYINSIVVFTEGEMIPFWYSIMMIMGVFISFMGFDMGCS